MKRSPFFVTLAQGLVVMQRGVLALLFNFWFCGKLIFTHVTIITLSGHKPLGTETNAKLGGAAERSQPLYIARGQ